MLGTVGDWVEVIRPLEWLKNLLVLAPVCLNPWVLTQPDLMMAVILTATGFCLVASAGYVVNDLFDRGRDGAHPTKRHRPIAAGRISLPAAISVAFALLALGLAITSLIPVGPVLPWVAGYAILTLSYSALIKTWPIAEIVVLACAFPIRIAAGSEALQQHPSWWALAAVFGGAMMVVLAKRQNELARAPDGDRSSRPVLARYRADGLAMGQILCGLATALVFLGFLMSNHAAARYDLDLAAWTILPVFLALARFASLARREGGVPNPTRTIALDPVILVCVAATGMLFLLAGQPS